MATDRRFEIDGKVITDRSDCFVIAEIGHNHQGKLHQCFELFKAAKECGAHAVKLQKRNNEALFTRAMYDQPYDNPNSYGDTYGEHRNALEFGKSQYLELKAYAKELGITFFSTAFDVPSADFLMDIDLPAFKMASGDLTNIPLLTYVAKLGKPMVISTGGGKMEDVRRAVDAIMPLNDQVAILQCTSGYPCAYEELNLRVIETFRREFPRNVIGLSSHDSGIAMGPVAYVLGARIIEKHFTLNRTLKGTDHAFSLEPTGLRKLCRDLKRTVTALGDGVKIQYESEKAPLKKMGKKLVASRDLPADTIITERDIAVKSPNDGLPPFEFERIVGARLKKALKEDENFRLEDLSLVVPVSSAAQ